MVKGIPSLFCVSLARIKMCGKPSDSPLLAEDNTLGEHNCKREGPHFTNSIVTKHVALKERKMK